MSIAEQLSLAPEAPIRARNQKVPLRRINLGEGWSADIDLVRSVQEYGVLEPVVLEVVGDRFDIIDGRRRTHAAQTAGLKSIPARVVEIDGWLGREVLGILLNEQRGPNPVSELQAIEALMAAGKSEHDISRATGMDAATIRKRLKLTKLIPVFREELENGEIKVSLAESIAALPEALQVHLLLLTVGRNVTSADVREIRLVRREEATAPLVDVLREIPATTEIAVGPWQLDVRNLLSQAIELIPNAEGWAWSPLVSLVEQLDTIREVA